MIGYHKVKRYRGFSLIELIVAIALLAILMAVGIINISMEKQRRQFATNCDKIVQILKEGQSQGRAFAAPPSGYGPANFASISTPPAGSNVNYQLALVNSGLGRAPTLETIRNVNISTNFDIQPPTADSIQNYHGASVIFAFNEGASPQTMLYFNPAGVPSRPDANYMEPGNGLNNATDTHYRIRIAYLTDGGTKVLFAKRIIIDRTQGTIVVQRRRPSASNPDINSDADWEADY